MIILLSHLTLNLFSEIVHRSGSKVISFRVVVTFGIKKPPEGG